MVLTTDSPCAMSNKLLPWTVVAWPDVGVTSGALMFIQDDFALTDVQKVILMLLASEP